MRLKKYLRDLRGMTEVYSFVSVSKKREEIFERTT